MKSIVVRADQIKGDGHYNITYPDGRVLVFDLRDGRWDRSKPAYQEIRDEEGKVRRDRVRVVLETELSQFEEYDDYRPYDF